MTKEGTAEDEDPNVEAVTTGAKNGLTLKDYDDEKWDQLLDQLSIDDMNTLISGGGYQTAAVESVGKVRTGMLCTYPNGYDTVNFTETNAAQQAMRLGYGNLLGHSHAASAWLDGEQ